MISYDKDAKLLTVDNNTLHFAADFIKGIRVVELTNRFGSKTTNKDQEFLSFDFMGGHYTTADLDLISVTVDGDNTSELATALLENKELALRLRVCFLNDKKDTLNIVIQLADDYKYGVPYKLMVHSPFLAAIEAGSRDDVYYYPARPGMGSNKKSVIRPVRETFATADIKLPLVVTDEDGKLGFSVRFPSLSDLGDEGSTQKRNMVLNRIASEEDLKHHLLPFASDSSYNDCAEFEIVGLRDGWVEAFDRYRAIWQSAYDFSEYDKKDLHWFNECVVHNFTFLFGRESFDLENAKTDVAKILKDGEDFGGYDTVTVWNQYPRLGIDERSQWDFHDDFPGGRAALRQMVKEYHDKGVYVFMPYIPWDQGYDESTNSMGTEFAKVIADTDADGYQLDTMNQIPESFRNKLNAVRPGIILTTQQHPMKKRPMEIITTSWDEFWDTGCMPEMDVLRFLFPRHISPVISRWYRKEDKDQLIERAKFGAAPIVIWQDIFGRWMPFSKEQRASIKEWKGVYLAHRLTYQCLRPIPLYPVRQDNLYCNVFRADDGSEHIYSLYNDSDKPVKGEILGLLDAAKKSVTKLLGNAEFEVKDGKLYATIPPKQVVHLSVK